MPKFHILIYRLSAYFWMMRKDSSELMDIRLLILLPGLYSTDFEMISFYVLYRRNNKKAL